MKPYLDEVLCIIGEKYGVKLLLLCDYQMNASRIDYSISIVDEDVDGRPAKVSIKVGIEMKVRIILEAIAQVVSEGRTDMEFMELDLKEGSSRLSIEFEKGPTAQTRRSRRLFGLSPEPDETGHFRMTEEPEDPGQHVAPGEEAGHSTLQSSTPDPESSASASEDRSSDQPPSDTTPSLSPEHGSVDPTPPANLSETLRASPQSSDLPPLTPSDSSQSSVDDSSFVPNHEFNLKATAAAFSQVAGYKLRNKPKPFHHALITDAERFIILSGKGGRHFMVTDVMDREDPRGGLMVAILALLTRAVVEHLEAGEAGEEGTG